MNFNLSAKKLTLVLLTAVCSLTLIHLTLQAVRFWLGDHRLGGLLAFFSLGADNNVPTFYSALAILACSVLLVLIAIGEARIRGYKPFHWALLGAIFLFLSMDEMLMIHERLSEPMQSLAGDNRLLHYAWVIPYAAFVVLFVIGFARFLFGLPRRTAAYFLGAGALFVGGAIGLEMISGYHASAHGTTNIPYVFWQSLEEIMEMLGIVLFFFALGDYAERRFGSIQFQLSPSMPRAGN